MFIFSLYQNNVGDAGAQALAEGLKGCLVLALQVGYSLMSDKPVDVVRLTCTYKLHSCRVV